MVTSYGEISDGEIIWWQIRWWEILIIWRSDGEEDSDSLDSLTIWYSRYHLIELSASERLVTICVNTCHHLKSVSPSDIVITIWYSDHQLIWWSQSDLVIAKWDHHLRWISPSTKCCHHLVSLSPSEFHRVRSHHLTLCRHRTLLEGLRTLLEEHRTLFEEQGTLFSVLTCSLACPLWFLLIPAVFWSNGLAGFEIPIKNDWF